MYIDKKSIYEQIKYARSNGCTEEELIDIVYNKASEDSLTIIKGLLDLDNNTLEDIFDEDNILRIIKNYDTTTSINNRIEDYISQLPMFIKFDEIYNLKTNKKGIITKLDQDAYSIHFDILFDDYSVDSYNYSLSTVGKLIGNNIIKLTGTHYNCIEEFLKTINKGE